MTNFIDNNNSIKIEVSGEMVTCDDYVNCFISFLRAIGFSDESIEQSFYGMINTDIIDDDDELDLVGDN